MIANRHAKKKKLKYFSGRRKKRQIGFLHSNIAEMVRDMLCATFIKVIELSEFSTQCKPCESVRLQIKLEFLFAKVNGNQ